MDARQRLSNIVNLANCYALLGRNKKRDEAINKHDWTSCSDDFLICISAIRLDTEKVIQLMRKLKYDKEWREQNYEEWPVFFHVRDNKDFIAEFESIYGRALTPSPKKKRTMDEIITAMEKLSKRKRKPKLELGKNMLIEGDARSAS